jgi:NADH-quinone oxidoreductase subunit D
VGAISAEDAMAFGFTGPQLRSTGVAMDVRRDHPYLVYDRLEFDVPVGTTGDCYDRFLVRLEEIDESMRIIEQALEQMPPGPILVNDPLVTLPPKPEVYDTIEGMIRHFKLVFDGIKVPPGEAYAYTESANGELGFYVVADGSGRPYKCRSRGPSFTMTQAVPHMILGRQVADIIPIFGQINYIGGEAER